jgi:hypothetical protein
MPDKKPNLSVGRGEKPQTWIVGVQSLGSYRGRNGQLYGPHSKAKTHYVYGHVNPWTGEVFYVGIGRFNRCNQIKQRNKYWSNYVAKHGFMVQLISQGLTRDQAATLEVKLIKERKPKCNLTHGGEVGTSSGMPVFAFNEDGALAHSFETISEANVHFGAHPNDPRISRCLKGKRQRYKGFLWSKSKDVIPQPRPRITAPAKTVHQYDMQGKWVATYASPRHAPVPTGTGIYGCLDAEKTYQGSFWRSKKVERISVTPPTAALKPSKAVACLKTGVVYDSITKAAESIGIRRQNLIKRLRNWSKQEVGFEYYEQES